MKLLKQNSRMDSLKNFSAFSSDVDYQENRTLNNFKALNILFKKLLLCLPFFVDFEVCLLLEEKK